MTRVIAKVVSIGKRRNEIDTGEWLCHGSAPDSLSYGQGALTILLAYYIGKKVNCS